MIKYSCSQRVGRWMVNFVVTLVFGTTSEPSMNSSPSSHSNFLTLPTPINGLTAYSTEQRRHCKGFPKLPSALLRSSFTVCRRYHHHPLRAFARRRPSITFLTVGEILPTCLWHCRCLTSFGVCSIPPINLPNRPT